jgi:hypothetical protein
MENDFAFGYPVKTAKQLGLETYFKGNPQVAGMAWGGGENGSDPKSERVIVANPYNKYMEDPGKRTGLLKIEAARHLMGEKQYDPSFDINPDQQIWRKSLGKYADNDLAFKQSIISRILSGDDVPFATKQQMEEAGKIEEMLMYKARPMGAKEAVKQALKKIESK